MSRKRLPRETIIKMENEMPSWLPTRCIGGAKHHYDFELNCIKCHKYAPDIEREKAKIRNERIKIKAKIKKGCF